MTHLHRLFATIAASVAAIASFIAMPTSAAERVPLAEVSHIHGIAVDPRDPSRLFLATHYGVYLAAPDGLAERTDGRDGLIGYEVVRRRIAEGGEGAALTVLAALIDLIEDGADGPFEDDVTAVVIRRI